MCNFIGEIWGRRMYGDHILPSLGGEIDFDISSSQKKCRQNKIKMKIMTIKWQDTQSKWRNKKGLTPRPSHIKVWQHSVTLLPFYPNSQSLYLRIYGHVISKMEMYHVLFHQLYLVFLRLTSTPRKSYNSQPLTPP